MAYCDPETQTVLATVTGELETMRAIVAKVTYRLQEVQKLEHAAGTIPTSVDEDLGALGMAHNLLNVAHDQMRGLAKL